MNNENQRISAISVIYTTVSSQKEAKKIAMTLIERKLAACINILGQGQSLYFYDDQIFEEQEVYLLIKTNSLFKEECLTTLEEIHPYDTPAIIELGACHANLAYGEFIHQTLKR